MAKKDTLLQFLISENSRAKVKDISSVIKASPPLVKYKIKQLLKENIIYDPYTLFDYSYFGQILFRVYFKGAYISEKDKEKIIKELKNNSYILSIYEMTGEYDIGIEFAAKNPSRFNKELKKIFEKFSTLNDYKIILNLVSYIYPRDYITKKGYTSNDQDIHSTNIIGGDRDIEEMNNDELKIIKNILINPNIRFTKLAKECNLNVKTAKKIFLDLKKRKIVRAFKYNIDTNSMGITSFRFFIKLHNMSHERELKLMDFLLKVDEIIQVNKTVGDWNMEIDIESLDKKNIRAIILRLREDFKDIIENFTMIEIYKNYKKTYLPMSIFEEKNGNLK